jgi:hypothetical protein
MAEVLARAGDQAACARAIADGFAAIEAMKRTAYGDPVPFPADLDPAYLPDAVEARARRVATECPELGLQLLDVDCSEFPCFTVWNTMGATSFDPNRMGLDLYGLDACPAWSSVPRDDAITNSHHQWIGPDGEDIHVAKLATYPPGWWEAHPPEPWAPGIRKTRVDVRTESILGDLQSELGAREPTWVEQLERAIEHSREAGSDEATLEALREQLEKARAEEVR